MGLRTAGDRMFENYLVERRFAVPVHEPDLGIGVRPDYVPELDGNRCVCEVKEFARGSWPIRRGVNSQQQVLKPIRGQIHEAARKLRKATHLKLPLVVVLTDPNQALHGLLWPRELIAALLGDLTVVVPIPTSGHGDMRSAALVPGRNGELRNDHPYVTAVLVVHTLDAGKHWSHMYVTNSPGAESMPDGFFTREGDEVYEYSDEARTYALRSPVTR